MNTKLILTASLGTMLLSASFGAMLLGNDGADDARDEEPQREGYARSIPTHHAALVQGCGLTCARAGGDTVDDLPPAGEDEGATDDLLVQVYDEVLLERTSRSEGQGSGNGQGEYQDQDQDESAPEPQAESAESRGGSEVDEQTRVERASEETVAIPQAELGHEVPALDAPQPQQPAPPVQPARPETQHPEAEKPKDPDVPNYERPGREIEPVPLWHEVDGNVSVLVPAATFEGVEGQHRETPSATLPATCQADLCHDEMRAGGDRVETPPLGGDEVGTPAVHVNETKVGPVATLDGYDVPAQHLATLPSVPGMNATVPSATMHAICAYAPDVCLDEQQVGPFEVDTPAVDGFTTPAYLVWTGFWIGAGIDANGDPAASADFEPGFGSA